MAAILAVLLVATGWVIARSILRELGGEPTWLNHITHQIAQGDLTVDIPSSTSNNSVMHGIQAMRDNLSRVVIKVRQAANPCRWLRPKSPKATTTSARTEQQAAAIEQTSASMGELGGTVNQNADSARQANQLATSASSVACKAVKSSTAWEMKPCATSSTNRHARSPTSSASSTASRSRPTSWR